jgi:hypothetical protein
MSGFITGGFANLQGFRTGSLSVERLLSRDRAGIPRWEIMCTACRARQIIDHRRLAAALETRVALPCTNPQCPSRRENRSETLVEFNRRQRREAEQTARETAEAQAKAETEAAKLRAKQEQLASLKNAWRELYRHHLRLGVDDSKIPTWEQWQCLGNMDRQRIMDAIHTDETVRVELNN